MIHCLHRATSNGCPFESTVKRTLDDVLPQHPSRSLCFLSRALATCEPQFLTAGETLGSDPHLPVTPQYIESSSRNAQKSQHPDNPQKSPVQATNELPTPQHPAARPRRGGRRRCTCSKSCRSDSNRASSAIAARPMNISTGKPRFRTWTSSSRLPKEQSV